MPLKDWGLAKVAIFNIMNAFGIDAEQNTFGYHNSGS